jgi:Ca-activated chloride channel homolog
MHFAHSELLWLVVTVGPLMAVFLWWSWRRRKRLMLEFVPQRLLAALTVGFDAAVERRRLALLVAAVGLLLVALARPQWGLVWEETVTQGRDILVAVDASKSMLAMDAPPTDRLTRAKLAALDLAHIAKSDRFGLIAFAGSAFLQCPLTLDEFAFSQSVNAIDADIIPQGGTALAEAIDTAVKAFDKSGDNHRVLVMLTDGEDHEEGVKEAIRKAQKAGLKIFTVGVGTPEGEVIRIPDEQGNMGFLRDEQGNAVKSRLNESLLKEIATDTGGFYLPLSGARPMETLFKKGIELLPKSESASKMTRSYREQFHWFVLVAVAALIAEMFWRGKPKTEDRDAAPKKDGILTAPTVVALALLLCGFSAKAAPSEALRDFKEGEFGKSQAEYERLLEERTKAGKEDEKVAKLEFNAGSAAYKAGDLEKARRHFVMSAGAEDLALQQQSYYNLGNTVFRQGEASPDLEEREIFWEDAVRNLKNAVQLDEKDPDAKHNLAFAEKRLELLKKKLDEMAAQQDQQNQGQQGKQGQKSGRRSRRDRKQQGQQQPGQNPGDQNQQGSGRRNQKEDGGGDKKEEKKDSGGGEKDQQGKDGGDKQEGENGEGSNRDTESASERAAMAMGVMTPKQAQQLLEAMKAEEKSIIFLPPQKGGKPPQRSIKDW